jgi:hypothetical protein
MRAHNLVNTKLHPARVGTGATSSGAKKSPVGVLAGVGALSLILGLQACSSGQPPDEGHPSNGPVVTDATTAGATGMDAGAQSPSLDAGGAGAEDGSCKPLKLRAPPDAGIPCPRSKDDGGTELHCARGSEVCCVVRAADAGRSTCDPGPACPAEDTLWACASPEDCASSAAGKTCCLAVSGIGPDKVCPAYRATTGRPATRCVEATACTGTVDAAKLPDTLYVVCATQADCPAGMTCTPIRALGIDMGLCLQ